MKFLNEIKKLVFGIYLRITFALLKLVTKITRHPKLKTDILRHTANFLSDTLAEFDSHNSLIVSNRKWGHSKTFAFDRRILLSNAQTHRYLAQSGESGFEGYALIERLRKFGISKPKTLVDVGANFGEISLCFAAEFPECKIIAVEPSSLNLEILEENLGIQVFDTSSVFVRKFAIADEPGEALLTRNLGSQNSIVAKRGMLASQYEKVPCKRLDELFREEKVRNCDFLKIDIEGAEPGLKDSLAAVLGKTRAVLLEFSHKNTPENYAKLVEKFASSEDKWICFDNDAPDAEIALELVIDYLLEQRRAGIAGRDFWFVKQKSPKTATL